MSSSMKITVLVEVDGVEHTRLVRRLAVDEVQSFQHEKATGGGYVALPTSELAEVQVLVVEAVDQQLTIRLDGQSDAGLVLNAGGFLVAVDVDLDAGATTNATLDNSSGATALVRGVAGGT